MMLHSTEQALHANKMTKLLASSAANLFNAWMLQDPPLPGTPGGVDGPPVAAPAPPAPNPPPCTLAPYLCPFPSYTYISYYSIDRSAHTWCRRLDIRLACLLTVLVTVPLSHGCCRKRLGPARNSQR